MAALAEALKAFTGIFANYHGGKLFKLNFAVTYRCNSRCSMCNTWKRYIENPKLAETELDTSEIHRIFNSFGKLVWMSLTGGEPFLRKDLANIVQFARDCCHIKMLNITTNGFNSKLVEDQAQAIAEIKIPLTFINVSLDGPAGIHDHARGTKGAYDKAIKTLKILHRLSVEYSNLSVGFEYTATPFNAGHLKLLVNELKHAELDWLIDDLTVTMYHAGNLYRTADSTPKQPNNTLLKLQTLEDINDALSLTHTKSPLALIRRTYLKHARNYISEGAVPLQCVALRNSLFLDPYGNVYPCVILEQKIDNLRDYQYDIHRLLKSKSAQELRQIIDTCRKCWTPCEAYPTILTHLSCIIKAK
ncbi:MAG TPA: radical SAM protein [Candidatus Bathyarchaeia archaeon]|nr:radical SAM protein [Candidatus Bathyarchaeia archaeon]